MLESYEMTRSFSFLRSFSRTDKIKHFATSLASLLNQRKDGNMGTLTSTEKRNLPSDANMFG